MQGKAGAGLRRDRRRVIVVGHNLHVHPAAHTIGVLDVELGVGIQHVVVIDDVQPEVVRGCELRLVRRAVAEKTITPFNREAVDCFNRLGL